MSKKRFPYQREIEKKDLVNYDLWSYDGPVRLIDSKAKLDKFKSLPKKKEIIGFDTETKPSFKKGIQHPCSLVQIAYPNEVILFRLNKIGFPNILQDILSDERYNKIGIAIHDDIKQLKDIEPFEENAFIDLNVLSPELGFTSIGAQRLSALVLGKRISKRQQVSNWEAKELSPGQIKYAATDAWICREIFLDFERKGLVNRD